MSDSESFESAKDENYEENNASEDSSEDEPLVKKSASPKKSLRGKTTKKGRPSKKDAKKKDKGKKKGRVSFSLGPTESNKPEEEYEVEAIVGHREYNGKLMYKIRWKNYGPVDDTWESYNSLSCPDLLEAYNLKNDVSVPKKLLKGQPSKKRKASGGGKKATNGKKRRSSVEEESDDDDSVPFADESNDDEEYEVEKIVQMRYKKDGSREFLVHWKRWSKDYDTWEPESNLSCPDIIEKFMKHVNDNKDVTFKELRANRKHTDRFTLNTHDSGRRLSRRHRQKLRVTYYNDAVSDED